jgi:hypothetical protein
MDASKALERALQNGPLSVVAIGPVTKVPTVLNLHCDLARSVRQIIAAAYRRPGQQFAYCDRQTLSFQDVNFEAHDAVLLRYPSAI